MYSNFLTAGVGLHNLSECTTRKQLVGKSLNMNVRVLGRAQCACPEMAHSQFKIGWGWVLQAGVEQSYSSCVNGDNTTCMNRTDTTVKTK